MLASALNASTEAGHAVPRELEKLLSGLIEKLEWVQLTHTDHAALAHLEDRIAALVKRLDASDCAAWFARRRRARARRSAGVYRPIARRRSRRPPKRRSPPAPRAEFAEIKQSERLPATLGFARGHAGHGRARRRSSRHDRERHPWSIGRKLRPGADAFAEARAPAPPPLPARIAKLEAIGRGLPVISEPARRGRACREPVPQRPAATRTPIDPSLPPDHPLEPGSAGSLAQSAVRCRTHRRVRSRGRIRSLR